MESGDTAPRVKSLEAIVDQMEAEFHSLEQTLKRYGTSGVEAALHIILKGSARVELKIGGITKARQRVGRADAAHRSDRREDTAVEEEIGPARQCRKGADMGQLEEDSAQINEKIRDLIDVHTVQVEPEDFGWLSSPLFDGAEVRRTKRNGGKRCENHRVL